MECVTRPHRNPFFPAQDACGLAADEAEEGSPHRPLATVLPISRLAESLPPSATEQAAPYVRPSTRGGWDATIELAAESRILEREVTLEQRWVRGHHPLSLIPVPSLPHASLLPAL